MLVMKLTFCSTHLLSIRSYLSPRKKSSWISTPSVARTLRCHSLSCRRSAHRRTSRSNGSVFSRRLSRSRIMRNLFWMRRTMSLYPSCLMLSEPVFCSSATIARISGIDSRTTFCSSFNRRFSIARILLSAHCGYSGSSFDFFVIEERPVMPGPLFFTGISTSLSFWEPSSLCRHQKDPASPP